MEDLWEAIKAWPVIVQGAMGSALFAGLLAVGQKLTRWVVRRLGEISKARRKDELITEQVRLKARHAADAAAGAFHTSVLLTRASRRAIKGLIWLALGFCFDSFVGVLGIVGYLGCIFYMLGALDAVKPIPFDPEAQARIDALQKEILGLQAGEE